MRNIRRNFPGVVYHVIWRFVDQRYFIQGPRERRLYLDLLGRALAESDWRCLSYALMSNHIHLGLLAGRSPMTSWSRRVNSPFAAWINERTKRIGPVFAQPAKDFAIMPAGEAKLIAYIHRNPVRAGLVTRAIQSTWTSHRYFVSKGECPSWLHVDEALARIGMTAREFGHWIDGEEGESGEVDTEQFSVALRKRGALRIATPSVAGVPIVARTTAYWRADPRTIVRLGCEIAGTPIPLVCSRRLLPGLLTTRRAVVFAALEQGISCSEIGDSLGLSQQAVSKIARRLLTAREASLLGTIRERLQLESGGSGVRPGRYL